MSLSLFPYPHFSLSLSLSLSFFLSLSLFLSFNCLVGWGCRIHRLLFCWGVRLHHNECPVYDTKQSDGEVPVMLELWGMRSTPSLPSLSGSLWLVVVAPEMVLSMGQIELKRLLMLNWVAWNRTVSTLKLRTYTKLNCLKWKCFSMLNCIVWNITGFNIETVLTLNSIVWLNIIIWNINAFNN